MPAHVISTLSNQYHGWVSAHPDAAEVFKGAIEDLLNDAGVIFDRVSTRVKTWPSLKAKAKKRKSDGQPVYPQPWDDINDLIGARVTIFHSTAMPQALEVFGRSFDVVRSVDKAAETRASGGFGYGSHHLILTVTDAIEELLPFKGMRFEVQVRTVLQHAWAEFEHDIRYKQGPIPPTPEVDRLFTLAAGLIELADQQFDQIATLKDPSETKPDSTPTDDITITAETLPGILAVLLGERFPRSRSEHYRWLAELLELGGITTMAQLEQLLDYDDIQFVRSAIRYRFRPSQVRLIDDLLLHRLGRDYIEATADTGTNHDRRARLGQRLKMLSQARAQADSRR